MTSFLKSFPTTWRLQKANNLLRKKKYQVALDTLAQIKNIDSDYYFPWRYYEAKGIALFHLGKFDDALDNLYKAEEDLAPLLVGKDSSDAVLSVLKRITWFINKSKKGRHVGATHNKSLNADASDAGAG
jgi:tetratricopeptide (TPR) repeat protein